MQIDVPELQPKSTIGPRTRCLVPRPQVRCHPGRDEALPVRAAEHG